VHCDSFIGFESWKVGNWDLDGGLQARFVVQHSHNFFG